jgi:hypothetical protein
MAIILKANIVNLFVSSVLFVFWYHSPNLLDTPRISFFPKIDPDVTPDSHEEFPLFYVENQRSIWL